MNTDQHKSKAGDIKTLKLFLKKVYVQAELDNEWSDCVLRHASNNGHLEVVKLMVTHDGRHQDIVKLQNK